MTRGELIYTDGGNVIMPVAFARGRLSDALLDMLRDTRCNRHMNALRKKRNAPPPMAPRKANVRHNANQGELDLFNTNPNRSTQED